MMDSYFNVPVDGYIDSLFRETADGKLTLTRYPENGQEPYEVTYSMDWDARLAAELAQRFETLRAHLESLGAMHDALTDEETAKELLNGEEFAVWQTYVKPFAPFDADPEALFALQMKDVEDLTLEEAALLKRHFRWREAQSLQRLPRNRRSPVDFINRAKRYERLVGLKAPKVVVENEAYCLALEMVLYYATR